MATGTINDLMYAFYKAGAPLGDQTGIQVSLISNLAAINQAEGLEVTGKVSAPTAGVTIAELLAVEAGTWQLEITTFIMGDTDDTDVDNMKIAIDGLSVATILNPVPDGIAQLVPGQFKQRVHFEEEHDLSVIAVAAADPGATYFAQIIMIKEN